VIWPVSGEGHCRPVPSGGQNRPSEEGDRQEMQAEAGRGSPIRDARLPEIEQKYGDADRGQGDDDLHRAGSFVADEVTANAPCE
jgi:hypothetical protein